MSEGSPPTSGNRPNLAVPPRAAEELPRAAEEPLRAGADEPPRAAEEPLRAGADEPPRAADESRSPMAGPRGIVGLGDKASVLERINQGMIAGVPFNAALGLRVVDFDHGQATLVLPYRAELVGNPATGVLAGGLITSAVDAACGMAVFLRLEKLVRIATLDLRVDYLRPARPPLDVSVRAECFHATRHIAFVRALAFHAQADDPIASAAGTFMIFDDERSALREAIARASANRP